MDYYDTPWAMLELKKRVTRFSQRRLTIVVEELALLLLLESASLASQLPFNRLLYIH
jgi:hypothetical protein